jgi:hypothetical protein
VLNNPGTSYTYGCEFSPDESKLYACVEPTSSSNATVYQYNLLAGSSASVNASATLVGTAITSFNYGAFQLAPNGHIYIARENQNYLAEIKSPNTAGTGCNFVDKSFKLATKLSQLGLPNSVYSITVVPLPVELILFMGENIGSRIHLSWSTASEINNDYFSVERSVDGNSFSEIGKVNGHGNSSETLDYFFDDLVPFQGINYYRLNQVDYNGDFHYSKVIAIANNSDNNWQISITEDGNNILLNCQEMHNGIISIIDMSGKVIKEIRIRSDKTSHVINLGNYANGIYLLRISDGTKAKAIRFVKSSKQSN